MADTKLNIIIGIKKKGEKAFLAMTKRIKGAIKGIGTLAKRIAIGMAGALAAGTAIIGRYFIKAAADAEESEGPSLYLSTSANPAEVFEKNEMREILWKGLMQLKKEDREIIILKEFQELSYKEIAEVLNIPVGSVMSRLFYARKKL